MKNISFLSLLAFCVSLAILGCEESTSSSTPQDFNASHRTISTSLRSSCSDTSDGFIGPVAKRSLGTTVSVSVQQGPTYQLQFRIYDSTGSFRAKEELPFTTDSIATVRIRLGWNGADSSGALVGNGNYFLFSRFLDSAGAVVRTDSTCVSFHLSY